MNIRGKLTAGMCVLLGALCVGVLATVHLLLLPQVEELERQSLQLDLERSHQTLMQEQKRLLSIAADWAQWDETYQFVQDRNQDYVASNLIDDFLIPLQADFLVILDQNGDAIANLHSDKLGAPELTAIAQGAEGITAPL
ncbi:CHASE4 domain-containing protein, partial [Marinobacter mobilis]